MSEIEGLTGAAGSVVVGVVPRTAEHVVHTAVDLADRYGVGVVVVSVEPDRMLFAEGLDGTALGYPVDLDDGERPRFDGSLEARLRPLGVERGVPVRFVAASGQPATVLAAVADHVDAPFVVVGSREAGLRGSVREFFAGSVAVHLTHHQHRPVVVVPLEPAARRDPAVGARSVRPRPHLDPRALALVALGGALGTALRVAVSLVVPRVGAVDLPTVLVNVVGAFLLGLLLGRLARSGPDEGRRRDLRLGLGTGVLGGFTTWSALATGTVTTAGSGHLAIAVAEGLGSVLLGVLAAGGGLVVAGRGSGGPGRPVAPVPPAEAPPGPAAGPRP